MGANPNLSLPDDASGVENDDSCCIALLVETVADSAQHDFLRSIAIKVR